MPYKCSIRGCQSNYDSTNEKVSVFQFPSNPELRAQWLENVELTNSLTNSSRICIKHFAPHQIDNSTRRISLKVNAFPVAIQDDGQQSKFNVEYINPSCVESPQVVYEEADPTDEILDFTQFQEGLEEMTTRIIEHWNIFTQPDGICLYRLASTDGNFSNVNMSFKILVNKNLRVKIFRNECEASSEELQWTLKDCKLKSWSQFESIIDNYRHEPEVMLRKQTLKSLKKSSNALDEVQREELMEKIEAVKAQLLALYEDAANLPEVDEIDFYLTTENDEVAGPMEEFVVEERLEDDEKIIADGDDSQLFQLEMLKEESFEEPEATFVIGVDEDETIEFVDHPLKCKNCCITLLSQPGFRAHQKSCKTLLPNISKLIEAKTRKRKLSAPPSSDVNVCDSCGKSFTTSKGLKMHLKLHDHSLRQKCPHCDVIVFAGIMKRHINVVHNKVKPHSCKTCGKAFATSSLKNDHEKTHSKNLDLQQYLVNVDGFPRYSCPKCAADYVTTTLLRKHMENNCRLAEKKRVYRYPCAECSKTFITKIQAAQHMLDVHKVEIRSVDKFCFECNEEFEDYVNHVRVHSCNFACSFCGAKFLTQEKVQRHEKSRHSGETIEDRPFKCMEKLCGLSFKNINHLRSHQQAIHIQQEREFVCSHCDKKFALRALLTAHARSHMKDFAMFPCNFVGCYRRFKKLNNLKEHCWKEHNNWDIYLCNFEACDSRFKMLKELKQHREHDHGLAFNIHKYFDNQ